MSEPQAEEEKAEKVPRTSVHELPKLPVEFPPKDTDTEISGEFTPKKSVTFEISIEPSLSERKSREIDNRHGSILRSSSADTPSSSPSLKKKQLRRRSKSVIRIKQTPSYYFQGIENSEISKKRKAFAQKKDSGDDDAKDDEEAKDNEGVLHVDSQSKGERRGSFFHSVEQQVASLRRQSLSPQTSRTDKMYISPFVQMLSCLRESKEMCTHLEECCTESSSLSSGTKARVEALAVEIEENLDWCITLLQSMNSKKTAGKLAQEQFQVFLTQQSHELETTVGHQIAFWVAQTFTDKEAMVDDAVLMEPPLSGSLTKTSSFTEEGTLFGVSLENEFEIIRFFDKIDSWGMDMFNLNEMTKGHPLVTTSCAIFRKRNLWKTCKLHKAKFIRYMTEIESKYHPENPYHNCIHAADVMQTTHTLLNLSTFEGSFVPLEIVSLLVAAAVHDVDHPGKNNDFLKATGHELAILYHDQSVLESHHLAVAIRTLRKPECNFLVHLDDSQFKAFKSIVIDMVLATDMAFHYEHVGNMKSMLESKMATSREIVLDAYNDRVEVMKYMIHCADLSNPAKPLELCKKWTYVINEEFFLQGDEEKRLGLPVSAVMDRETVVVSQSVVGFVDYFVYPLFEVLTDLVYPFGDFILDNLSKNKDYWISLNNTDNKQLVKDNEETATQAENKESPKTS